MNELISSPWLTYTLVALNVVLWLAFTIIFFRNMFRK